MQTTDTRSIPEIVTAVTGDLADLVRKESELVRSEVSEKLQQATRAGMMLAIGGALLIGAFLVLLQALVLTLSKFMDPLWASVVVGVVVGLIGFTLVRSGTHKVKPAELMPERSSRQIQKDAQLVKGQAK